MYLEFNEVTNEVMSRLFVFKVLYAEEDETIIIVSNDSIKQNEDYLKNLREIENIDIRLSSNGTISLPTYLTAHQEVPTIIKKITPLSELGLSAIRLKWRS